MLVDLATAYDFVCYCGLSRKLLRFLPDRHLFRMIIVFAALPLTPGCWGNTVANSHLRPGPLSSRVLCTCLVSQCSHPPHRTCHQKTCSTQRSPVHRAGMHGISNRDTHLYPSRKNWSAHLTRTTTEVRRSERVTDGRRSGRRTLTRLRTFIPDIGTHPCGMFIPRIAWVRTWASDGFFPLREGEKRFFYEFF